MADRMAALERRYRRLLRAFPEPYRSARADEIVTTLLDLAGPRRRMPRPAEVADLVAGGLRQRRARPGPPAWIPWSGPALLVLAACAGVLVVARSRPTTAVGSRR